MLKVSAKDWPGWIRHYGEGGAYRKRCEIGDNDRQNYVQEAKRTGEMQCEAIS